MMNVLFFDPTAWVYDADTPFLRPLGGTQSAVAYLTPQLANLGIKVTVMNGTNQPRECRGVSFLHLPCSTEFLNSFDLIVVLSSPRAAVALRESGCTRPLILWCHHATDQPAIASLADPAVQAMFSGFAMVSQWQGQQYISAFGTPAEKMRVMRNAVSVPFMGVQPKRQWLDQGKPPVLAYTSTAYRGLDILLLAFPSIRAALGPDTRLKVFSSMGISQASKDENIISALFDVCRDMPGVEYVGPLPQSQLAEAMAEVDIWSYPCTFPETSCISAMEAMAAGSLVVTTNQGALPETLSGLGHAIDLSLDKLRPGVMASYYAQFLTQVVQTHQQNPDGLRQHLDRQMAFVRTHYTWENRAKDWMAFFREIITP